MFGRCSRRFVASTSATKASIPRRSLFTGPASSPSPQSLNPTRRARSTHEPMAYAPNHQIRCMAFSSKLRQNYRRAGRDIWRKNPIVFPLALLSVVGAGAFLVYTFYFQTMQINTRMSRFPEPVAKELRKALYYTEVNLEPQKAIEHYRKALRLCMDHSMHPYSDEVLGIKLQVADMYVKAGHYKQATHLLIRTSKEAIDWVFRTRKRLAAAVPDHKVSNLSEPNVKEIIGPTTEDYEAQYNLTTRVIKKIIGIQLLVADIVESEYLKDPTQAFNTRSSILKFYMDEIESRRKRGLPPTATPEEGDGWVSAEEASHTISGIGSAFLRAGRSDRALELLLPAIAILRQVEGKDITCRQVVLLSNIAAAMWDQRSSRVDEAADKKTPDIPVEKQIRSSKDWALKALEVSKLVHEDRRDSDCDMGCAGAADVLSAIAEWAGDGEEAKKWLLEEKRYCESAGYAEGAEKAAGLLSETEKRFAEQVQKKQT